MSDWTKGYSIRFRQLIATVIEAEALLTEPRDYLNELKMYNKLRDIENTAKIMANWLENKHNQTEGFS